MLTDERRNSIPKTIHPRLPEGDQYCEMPRYRRPLLARLSTIDTAHGQRGPVETTFELGEEMNNAAEHVRACTLAALRMQPMKVLLQVTVDQSDVGEHVPACTHPTNEANHFAPVTLKRLLGNDE